MPPARANTLSGHSGSQWASLVDTTTMARSFMPEERIASGRPVEVNVRMRWFTRSAT
jgi:hypothetical protein